MKIFEKLVTDSDICNSGSRGGAEGAMPPLRPVKISHKKDGSQRRPHRFHVSCHPHPAAGSDAVFDINMITIVSKIGRSY